MKAAVSAQRPEDLKVDAQLPHLLPAESLRLSLHKVLLKQVLTTQT